MFATSTQHYAIRHILHTIVLHSSAFVGRSLGKHDIPKNSLIFATTLNHLKAGVGGQLRLSMILMTLAKYFFHDALDNHRLGLLVLLNECTHQYYWDQHNQQDPHILPAVRKKTRPHYIFQTMQLHQQAIPNLRQGLDRQRKGTSDRALLNQRPLPVE